MTSLARFALPAGAAPSVTVDSAHIVSPTEMLIVYTSGGTVYADIFSVPSDTDSTLLETGAGDGEHLNAILSPGTGDSTSQPHVVSVQTIID